MSEYNDLIYLDNNATAPIAPECVEAMVISMHEGQGNPSSKHAAGYKSKDMVMEARGKVASFLGAAPPEVVFTSGGTESNHFAIMGALALQPEKRHIVTSTVEHPSTLLLLSHLESQGVQVTRVGVDSQGQLDLAELDKAITPETALVSLMWANNETGVLFPIEEAAALAKSKGCLFHTDAVQAAGKVPLDMKKVPADFLSISGHKLHGPQGIGVLFVRKGIKLPPLFFGHQERGRRGGTENVPGVVGLGKACSLAMEHMQQDEEHIRAMRDRLEAGIMARVSFARINGEGVKRISNTTNLRFENLNSEVLLDKLDKDGIVASSGAACTAGGTDPSHVLIAMGLDENAALSSIRFSLSRNTTEAEIDQVLKKLPSIILNMAAEAA